MAVTMVKDDSSKPTATTVAVAGTRQRKTHRKSRLGCGNCKLRSVKCDESKPQCKRCLASGFCCNYSRAVPELQLANAPGVFKVRLDLARPAAFAAAAPAAAAASPSRGLDPGVRVPVATPLDGQIGSYQLRHADCEALLRFSERTIFTVGNARLKSDYRRQALVLGESNPFLLHVFLAITFIHDAHLTPASSPSASHRASLAFHWYHATALFARLLARPHDSLTPAQRDALWAASTLLGAAAFAHLETTDPRRAWPLKEGDDPMDLDWLKLSEGKKAVLAVVDPSRPESLFNCIWQDAIAHALPDPDTPIPSEALPSSFYPLLGLSATSTSASNPYHGHASILAQLLPLELHENNLISFITFVGQPDPRYRHLLQAKDHRALLLLAWWYAKIAGCGWWWMQTRAVVDGAALCVYLARNSDDPRVLQLLAFPRAAFRMAGADMGVKAVAESLGETTDHVRLSTRKGSTAQ
ncbi:Sterol regulatory element-binding protein [Paramyrothecium foliicola]|nr:Sterol regulatory element-binding protein [Paramyrothecium foliicola]